MVQSYAALVEGDSGGGFPEELAVGIVGYTLRGPVEAVLVVGLVGAEADCVEVGDQLACCGGMDYEEDRRFVRFDLVRRQEFNVYFLGVVEVLGTMLTQT